MVPTLPVILTLAVVYWFPIRRWMSRWGATPSDLSRVMAGDSLLVDPASCASCHCGRSCRTPAGTTRHRLS